jgi:membrane protein DedA with SNARE-associated domain
LDSTHLLLLVAAFGYIGFAAIVVIAAIGVPLPLVVLLLASGAWSATAGGPNLVALMLVGTAAAVAGDSLDYAIGRMGSGLLRERVLGLQRRVRPALPAAVLDILWRRQGIAVFVTRCALTALSVPVSLLAGASRMRYARFLAWETTGKGLFVMVWLIAGRLFSRSLLTLGPLPTITAGLAALALMGLALFEARRWLVRRAESPASPPEPVAPRHPTHGR